MPPKKRRARPGGNGRAPLEIIAASSSDFPNNPSRPKKQEAAVVDSASADFDATACPILARHFFGVEPFRSIGEVAAEVVADLRFRRQVRRLHQLGPRVFGELLAEIGAERGIMTIIDKKLAHYAELNPEAIEAAGGDEFWPLPIHEVRSI